MLTTFKYILSPDTSLQQKIEIIHELAIDKVTAKDLVEIVQWVQTTQTMDINYPKAVDIVGTGGSWLPRINTSTITSIICARMGIKVMKHGNNAASGRFGSFDLLQLLGYPIAENPIQLAQQYATHKLWFLYAKQLYPIFRHAIQARKVYGKPTIFNLLWPLLNPAGCETQLIWCSFKDKMLTMAQACQALGRKHVYIVRGEEWLDEVTLTWKTDIVSLKDDVITEFHISPVDFGMETCSFDAIAWWTGKLNRTIALDILFGTCTTRHKDLVAINVATVLHLLGKVSSWKEGIAYIKNYTPWTHDIPFPGLIERHTTLISNVINKKYLYGKKLFKACGIRWALEQETYKVCDFIWYNFCPDYKRHIDLNTAKKARELVPSYVCTVGVFTDQSLSYILDIAKALKLDAVQLHAIAWPEVVTACQTAWYLVIKSLSYTDIHNRESYPADLFLIDAKQPWSGKTFDRTVLKNITKPFLLAWGIKSDNVINALASSPMCIGVDIASWIETNENIDEEKIKDIGNKIKNYENPFP